MTQQRSALIIRPWQLIVAPWLQGRLSNIEVGGLKRCVRSQPHLHAPHRIARIPTDRHPDAELLGPFQRGLEVYAEYLEAVG